MLRVVLEPRRYNLDGGTKKGVCPLLPMTRGKRSGRGRARPGAGRVCATGMASDLPAALPRSFHRVSVQGAYLSAVARRAKEEAIGTVGYVLPWIGPRRGLVDARKRDAGATRALAVGESPLGLRGGIGKTVQLGDEERGSGRSNVGALLHRRSTPRMERNPGAGF